LPSPRGIGQLQRLPYPCPIPRSFLLILFPLIELDRTSRVWHFPNSVDTLTMCPDPPLSVVRNLSSFLSFRVRLPQSNGTIIPWFSTPNPVYSPLVSPLPFFPMAHSISPRTPALAQLFCPSFISDDFLLLRSGFSPKTPFAPFRGNSYRFSRGSLYLLSPARALLSTRPPTGPMPLTCFSTGSPPPHFF